MLENNKTLSHFVQFAPKLDLGRVVTSLSFFWLEYDLAPPSL